MSNVIAPPPEQLPSAAALRRGTLVAVAIAVILAITVVLPAEWGIDPTGIGKRLGLKEMGEFKVEAARQFADDAAMVAKWKADSIAGRTPYRTAAADSSAATDSGRGRKRR